MKNFIIFHRQTRRPGDLLPDSRDKVWTTCLRQIAFRLEKPESAIHFPETFDGEIFHGQAAWAFILEVLCGLHSPVFGETEVLGQFKRFVDDLRKNSVGGKELLKLTEQILSDAKTIRSLHLQGIGRHSYGSILENWLKEAKSDLVNIVGTGVLSKKIFPWLSKSRRVILYSRSPEEAQKRWEETPCEIRSLGGLKKTNGILILTTALPSERIQEYAALGSREIIVDLRDTSKEDPLKADLPLKTLADLFKTIQTNDFANKALREQVLSQIRGLVEKRSRSSRAFGWEELCA